MSFTSGPTQFTNTLEAIVEFELTIEVIVVFVGFVGFVVLAVAVAVFLQAR